MTFKGVGFGAASDVPQQGTNSSFQGWRLDRSPLQLGPRKPCGDAILDDRTIDVYNHGDMERDFTYVADLVRAIQLLIPVAPPCPAERSEVSPNDSVSPVAPRTVNIGNSEPVRLLDFIRIIEEQLGKAAVRNYLPMQRGDVPATWANAELLRELTGYQPETNIRDGVAGFADWFRNYHQITGSAVARSH